MRNPDELWWYKKYHRTPMSANYSRRTRRQPKLHSFVLQTDNTKKKPRMTRKALEAKVLEMSELLKSLMGASA